MSSPQAIEAARSRVRIPPRGSPGYAAGLLACVLWMVFGGSHFLHFQSLWVDETTQLSGIALGPERLFPWLMGHGPDLGVPPDRSPPLAYLLGMAWTQAFGLSEEAMRWFGLVCSIVALIGASLAARRAFGARAGLVAAAFIALAPTLLVTSVEIRSYPLYLALASISTYAFVGAVLAGPAARTRWLAFLGTALLLTAYTHFFGVVLAAAAIGALGVDALRNARPLRPLVLLAVVVGVGLVGLAPFVLASAGISSPSDNGGVAALLLRLVKVAYRVYGHPVLANSTAATLAATAGFVVALGIACVARSPRPGVRDAVLTALALGLGVAALAGFVVKGFDTLSPTYNFWLVPLVAVALGSAATVDDARLRRVSAIALALLALGLAYTAVRLYRFPDVYAHGPQRQLFALIDELGPESVDVVYSSPASGDAFGLTVFPVRYRYGRSLPQYLLGAADKPIAAFDVNDGVAALPSRRYAIVVELQSLGASDLAASLARPVANGPPPLATVRLRESGWAPQRQARWPGMVTARVDVLAKP